MQNDIKMLPAGHHHGHRMVLLAGVIISLFIIILGFTIANSRTSFFGRAASISSITRIAGNLSLENSYLFASPISALSDAQSVVRITAIVLSDQGLGVANQQISLKVSGQVPSGNLAGSGVRINPIQPVTDTFGRAIFDLTSSAPGNYTISADVSNSTLPQTVSVVFR